MRAPTGKEKREYDEQLRARIVLNDARPELLVVAPFLLTGRRSHFSVSR